MTQIVDGWEQVKRLFVLSFKLLQTWFYTRIIGFLPANDLIAITVQLGSVFQLQGCTYGTQTAEATVPPR